MSRALIALAAICIIVVGSISGLVLYQMYTTGGDTGKVPDTLTFKITTMDQYLGSMDAATTMIDIYRTIEGVLVKQETVTLDAAQKETTNTYTSKEILAFHLYDSTDTSLCTLYNDNVIVPYASWSEQNDGSFQLTVHTVDKGDTAKDILIKYHNNTAIAASATLDVTNESWDSNFAEIDFEARALDDDTGYWNTYNFLKKYDNNHYIVLKASGTGWDSVDLVTSGWTSYDKAAARYFVKLLSDSDLSRDLQSTGEYDPDGRLTSAMVFDLTGFESGDSVTFVYEYRWYASWQKFQDSSNWGTDSAATSESVTIQY